MKLIFTCATTIFLITNYCFADVFDTIRDTNIVRTTKYNATLNPTIDPSDPLDLSKLSAETTKITNLLTKNVNTKVHATKEQQKKALQAVFSTEIIYGESRPSYLNGISETDVTYGHFYVLEYSALLARDYLQQQFLPGVGAFSLNPSKYEKLCRYSGLDTQTLSLWLSEIDSKHLEGKMTRFALQNPELAKKAFPSKGIVKPLTTPVAGATLVKGMKEDTYVLKSVMNVSVNRLAEAGASVSYPWVPQSLGNQLNVEHGALVVLIASPSHEPVVANYYQTLKTEIKAGLKTKTLRVTAENISQGAAYCVGRDECSLFASRNFEAVQTLFGSNANVEFSSPSFEFDSSFIDVNVGQTYIKIYPEPNLNSPIEYLQFLPKKTPVFIQGRIDFRNLSFDDFLVSHSDLVIKFRKQVN